MDSSAPTRTKPATAATPHPFDGRFKSVRINENLDENDDGDFDFSISPGGTFNSGTHTPSGGSAETLTKEILTRRTIRVKLPDGRFWLGSISSLLSDGQKKVVIGRYHIPAIGPDEKAAIAALGQDNGTWVATQP